jgi:succinate-semialdehyde dehydrogenase/glutarate-semialdehyde dehydrogenase
MDELAATVTAETGKPLFESYTFELFPALDGVCWTAANAARLLRPERIRRHVLLGQKRGFVVYRPIGVVALITPWNVPFAVPFTQAVAAVAAGNAVVVKPSELTPLSGEWVGRVFDEADAPAGLVTIVQGYGETTGGALAASPDVRKVIFTGSQKTGRRVAVAAGESLRPVTLELGGKDPMLVFEDADVDRTVDGALWAAFSNCGQVCTGVERIYVERGLYETFVEELTRRAGALRIGRGEELDTELGPLISTERRTRVEELVADATEHGADVRSGARRPDIDLPGWFYEPTVLASVPAEADLTREEIFGPVVTVAAFTGEEEAVSLANDSRYGLGASVWTRDLDRAARVGRRLEAGSVWTNDHAYSYALARAPWGGRKGSGFGSTHSRHGLYECSQVTFADVDTGRFGVPWWFPYSARAVDGFKGLLEAFYGRGLVTRVGAAARHRRGLFHVARRLLRR